MEIGSGVKALVTGAGSGIGRAISLALSERGVQLWLLDIDEKGLRETADRAGIRSPNVRYSVCDLSDDANIDRFAAECLETWDCLHLLVNCAGIVEYGPTHAISDRDWDRVMQVNLLAPIRLTRALLPRLIRQTEAHVVNLCSIFGLTTTTEIASYQASKFGLVGFSLALDAEYGRRGFNVTAICPGIVRTAMIERVERVMAKASVAMPTWIGTTPEIVARATIRAVERNRGLVVITPTAWLYWRVTRLSPTLVRWLHRTKIVSLLLVRRKKPTPAPEAS